MKKIINNPDQVVNEMIDGIILSHSSQLKRLQNENVVIRSDVDQIKESQVTLVSGGGSGHEPAHAGYVGPGMLTAAVCGNVFASPGVNSILTTIRSVSIVNGPGVLLVVKNYTGDRLNFGLAAQIANAEGYNVKIVVVADDCSLPKDTGTGRRGVAGTVLLHKILGAAAEDKRSLSDIVSIAQHVADHVISMGVTLGPCIIPEAGKPTFQLDDNKMVLGIGIHGEPGVKETALEPADRIVDSLLQNIVSESPLSSALKTKEGNHRVVLLINNLGSTTTMELYIAARRAIDNLQSKQNIVIDRVYVGNFMTSLEMTGLTLSLLCVYDEDLLVLLDRECSAPGWSPKASFSMADESSQLREKSILEATPSPQQNIDSSIGQEEKEDSSDNVSFLKTILKTLSDVAIDNETYLTELDQQCGDGDLGFTLSKLGHLVKKRVCENDHLNSLNAVLYETGMVAREIGGTSGVLYGVFILKVASTIRKAKEMQESLDSPKIWANAFNEGVRTICDIGGAKVGDCTMIDALQPSCYSFSQYIAQGTDIATSIREASASAKSGAETTRDLVPQKGRGSYIGKQAVGVPDPGAVVVQLYWQSVISLFN